jgi:hypothetical protein
MSALFAILASGSEPDAEGAAMEQSSAAESGVPVVRGVILAESLRPGTGFDGHEMRVARWDRYEVSDPAAYQPPIWTAIEFEAPAVHADALADDLADSLLAPGWYANWNSDTEATVVFPGKIFRYPRGDLAGRQAAQEHGRRCGVPEPQLDWTD